MSNLAIKTFMQLSLASLTGEVPMLVWAQQPKVTIADTDQCAVVVSTPNSSEERLSRPRGPSGTKQRKVQVRLNFTWVYTDDQVGGQNFDLLLDAIDKLIGNLPLPIPLIDPVTGEPSTLQDLGENIDTTLADPQTEQGPENRMIYLAEKRLLVKEYVSR